MNPFLLLIALAAAETIEENEPSQNSRSRQALAEHLPDIAALRIRKQLKEGKLSPAEKVEQQLLLVESLVRSGNVEEALELIPSLPASPAKNYWLGAAQAIDGNTDAAMESFAAVPTGDADFGPAALRNRLEILIEKARISEAEIVLERLQNLFPNSKTEETNRLESRILLAKKEFSQARRLLEADKSVEAKVIRGQIALAEGDTTEALAIFQEFLELPASSPLLMTARLGAVESYLTEGELNGALGQLLEILEDSPRAASDSRLLQQFERLENLAKEAEPAIQSQLASQLTGFLSTISETDNTQNKTVVRYFLARLQEGSEQEQTLRKLLEEQSDSAKPSLFVTRARFLLASKLLEEGKQDEAISLLKSARETETDDSQSALISDQLARIAADDENFAEASRLFAKAATHPEDDFADIARLNQTVAALAENSDTDPSSIVALISSEPAKTIASLKSALALAENRDLSAIPLLSQWIKDHPDSEHRPEAILALVKLQLLSEPPAIEEALSNLKSLSENLPQELSEKRFSLFHQAAALSGDWTSAVEFGEKHLKSFPKSGGHFLLRLGESRFRNGDYNRALTLFKQIEESEKNKGLAEVALLFGARANLAIPTPETTAEALASLDKLMKLSGPLGTEARLLKAETLNSLGQAEEALRTLENLPGRPGDQPKAALLAAQAYRELGSKDSSFYDKAISIYERLLEDDRTSYARSNQIHYLMARTHLANEEAPKALEVCLRVVDFDNKSETDQPEWNYYYQCGFEALDLLLSADRSRAALVLAEKLAAGEGPGATQAAARAEQIRLENLLWTE